MKTLEASGGTQNKLPKSKAPIILNLLMHMMKIRVILINPVTKETHMRFKDFQQHK